MKGRTDQTLHEVLRQMPYGLHVLGVRGDDGELNATVVSWVMQCSFFPPLLAVAVRKPSRTYELVKKGGVFTVNLIDKNDSPLVRRLVRPADHAGDKLGTVGHVEEDTGAPILRKAFAFVECKVRHIEEPGDHALIIGEAVNSGVHDHGTGEALTCSDMGWHYGG